MSPTATQAKADNPGEIFELEEQLEQAQAQIAEQQAKLSLCRIQGQRLHVQAAQAIGEAEDLRGRLATMKAERETWELRAQYLSLQIVGEIAIVERGDFDDTQFPIEVEACLLYTSPSPRDS